MASLPEEFQQGRCLPQEALERWLGACGAEVKVFHGCRIVPPDRVRVGARSQIDEGVFIFAGQGVSIGAHVHLAFGCSIFGGGWVEIGDHAGIGVGVRLISGSEDPLSGRLTNPTVDPALRGVRRGRIGVGAHALVFTNTVVLPDVEIGEGAVVAAGSIVHRSLKPWTIYAGNPLVAVGERPRVS